MAEQRLEVFGKLLAPGIPWVHRDEDPHPAVECDLLALERERCHTREQSVLDHLCAITNMP